MRIVSVVGARPQFIKAAVVTRALQSQPGIEEWMVHTGQHYDLNMSDIFFRDLEIPPPRTHLGIGSGAHGAQTGRMIEALAPVLDRARPRGVLVFGDTNSTLAAALTAAGRGIPIAHVEAGLRSSNRRMPEETNRILTDHLSELLFLPTSEAGKNLRAEGVDSSRLRLVGDVMVDAAIHHARKAEERRGFLDRQGLRPGEFVLVTIHRAENTDEPVRLRAIFGALLALARKIRVVLPLHPRTRAALTGDGLLESAERELLLLEPVGYLEMVLLEKNARLVATDSGGVQKEAYFHGVPCLTLRDETEWTELVESGWNVCVSPSLGAPALLERLEERIWGFEPRGARRDLYGDGDAGSKIARELLEAWGSPDQARPDSA